MYVYNNFIADKKTASTNAAIVEYGKVNDNSGNSSQQSIDQLTEAKTVINYVKQNHKLPDYYITKNEAKKLGWNPAKGNLCDILPGKAIGGDKFGNREGNLPNGEKYFEADVNYTCGNRNSDRIIFTKNGDVYLTKNHYKSFEKQ
jgi:guanyl-specific ribonuclease Sa